MSRDPRHAREFRFTGRRFDPATGEARLSYAFDDGPELTERLVFPYAPWPKDASRQAAFFRALELLHLLAGVSYYKAGLAPAIDTGEAAVDAALARFLEDTWVRGLGEFAHVNGLELEGRIVFRPTGELQPVDASLGLPRRALVAMGGGKDSLVALEMLRDAGLEVQPICVGESPLIAATAAAAGLPLIQVRRRLAPALSDLNAAGAWNGHVPVTAINAAVLLCAALLYGFRWVVFANERSADEATLTDEHGKPVNHQYSKSLEFEQALREIIATHVAPGVEVFSLLRPLSELAVARRFARLERYHGVFSSCNRNFHLDGPRSDARWCLDCPKCRFATLALAPFLAPARIEAFMDANLLDRPEQETGFRALTALGVSKPFECIGTVEESRAALRALSTAPDWSGCAVVCRLAPELPERGPGGSLDDWLAPSGPHCIPAEIMNRVAF